MKKDLWTLFVIMFGIALALPACKGDPGPAGAAGTPYTAPAPLCASPSHLGSNSAATTDTVGPNYLFANAVTVATPTTAISLSFNVPTSPVTGQIRLGIYNDNANYPGNLVAQAAPLNLTGAAVNNADLSPDIYLPAGVYWLAAITSSNTPITGQSTGGILRYVSSYGWSALPATFPVGAASSTSLLYYQVNTCP